MAHVQKIITVRFHKLFQLSKIATVKLHETASHKPTANQFEIPRTHRQERQKRKPGPEINRNQPSR
jgi:hypothetical protein